MEMDTPIDLEYLGVGSDSVNRAVWLLGQEGMLDKIMGGYCRPTAKLINEYELAMTNKSSRHEDSGAEGHMANSKNVFVVHGHDEAMESQVARFLERLKLTPIILHEQANKGRTIIEKFEGHSSDAGFAVVLLSPDDTGSAKGGTPAPRARQNVILELGYFIGKLGRDRVCALHAGEVELPSDLHGVVWVPYSGDWKLKLIQELRAAGINVNTDQL
jgi:predicted nucleotide-binding protein